MPILAMVACGHHAPPPPELAIVGESTRYRIGDPLPATSPWFDGARLTLEAAQNEIVGIQVVHAAPGITSLAIDGATVRAFAVEAFTAARPSTSMYGPHQGAGSYADGLRETPSPRSNPAYFEIVATTAGTHTGTLTVDRRSIPVTLTVHPVAVSLGPLSVWAYEDPRELAWAAHRDPIGHPGAPADPTAAESACVAMFHDYGVLLMPGLSLDALPARTAQLADFPYIPVDLTDDPAHIADDTRAWIAAAAPLHKLPFAIPIDEPHGHDAKLAVAHLADLFHAAGGGPKTFLFAVTDTPQPEYQPDKIDLYIQAAAAHLHGDRYPRWTYNGGEPGSGSLLLDARTPGMRTWGWIMYRYDLPVWYIWDALYWHDRHNRKRKKLALPGPDLDPSRDAVSFDDGDDHGNLDGVLALPTSTGSCAPTLRLAALRRGLQDRALLRLAAACHPTEAAALAAQMIPKALGDAAPGEAAAWPSDEAAWEAARRKLLALAACSK